jgi:hypothetical protein
MSIADFTPACKGARRANSPGVRRTYPMARAGDTENCVPRSPGEANPASRSIRGAGRGGSGLALARMRAHRLPDQRRQRQMQRPVGGEHVA